MEAGRCVIHIKYRDGYSPTTRLSRYPHDFTEESSVSNNDTFREISARLLAGEKFIRLPGGAIIHVDGVKAVWRTELPET